MDTNIRSCHEPRSPCIRPSPDLLRSQMLSLLYRAVRQGEMTNKAADRQLNKVRALRLRLLGDRVLENVACKTPASSGDPTRSTPSTSH